jgi:hypothetical protein
MLMKRHGSTASLASHTLCKRLWICWGFPGIGTPSRGIFKALGCGLAHSPSMLSTPVCLLSFLTTLDTASARFPPSRSFLLVSGSSLKRVLPVTLRITRAEALPHIDWSDSFKVVVASNLNVSIATVETTLQEVISARQSIKAPPARCKRPWAGLCLRGHLLLHLYGMYCAQSPLY